MTYRRRRPNKKVTPPVVPPLPAQDAPEEEIDSETIMAEMEECLLEEFRLGLELEDMLTDVTTPEESDDEPEPSFPTIGGRNGTAVVEQLREFLDCRVIPKDTSVPYFPLYLIPKYLRDARRKYRRVRHATLQCDFKKAFESRDFWRQYVRVRDLYPKTGGRDGLVGLIATYCYLFPSEDTQDTEEEEDAIEVQVELKEERKRKRKREDEDDGPHDPPIAV
jgi:hypothetical protein